MPLHLRAAHGQRLTELQMSSGGQGRHHAVKGLRLLLRVLLFYGII